MLNGIEVLNKVELKDISGSDILGYMFIVFGILLMVNVVVVLGGGVIEMMFDLDFPNFFIITLKVLVGLLISLLVTLFIIVVTSKEVPNGKYEYQVTITDEVKMKEFNAKYDIIKVDGKIYTIREKEGK